jgi:hypothetical protein
MTHRLRSLLGAYHPVVIEGMGNYEPRDPALVASRMSEMLASHWDQKPPQKAEASCHAGRPAGSAGYIRNNAASCG